MNETTFAVVFRGRRLDLVPRYAPASADWTALVLRVAGADCDWRTLSTWARQVGLSLSCLRRRCRVAGVSAKGSLDFGRVLRAVVNSGGESRPADVLSLVDERTLARLNRDAGIDLDTPSPDLLRRFVDRQTFVPLPHGAAVVRAILGVSEGETHWQTLP